MIFLLFLILLLPFFFLLIHIEIIKLALGKIGLSPGIALFVFFMSLLGSLVNIPVYSREATIFHPQSAVPPLIFFNPLNVPADGTKQIIAINLGGCIIPLLLCLYLLPKAPFLQTFFATAVTTVLCFSIARVVPGRGIMIPALVPPLAAVALAFIFSPGNKIPVAYISGVLGVLIGADLLHMPRLGGYPGMMSIGGAGVYDGIFLVGIISALLA